MTTNYTRLSAITRPLLLGSYVATLLLFTVNTVLVPSCGREANGVIWAVHCLPLLAFMPAILKQRGRAISWLCFLLLFYFLTSVPVAFDCASVSTVLEVFAIAVLFTAAVFHIRWHARATRQPHAIDSHATQEIQS